MGSDILTSISVPGHPMGAGLMDWGDVQAVDIIARYRSYAAHWRAVVEAIEQTPDADFRITVVRGCHVQHHVRTIQEGGKP